MGAPGFRINSNRFHPGQVNHQTPVTNTLAPDVMPTTVYGKQQIVVSGEIDGVHHISNTGATADQSGLPIDHCIPHRTGAVISGGFRSQQFPSQL
jgi:hypothetical protein